MTVWDELKARGLIAQVTDEEERWKKLCVEIPGQDCGLCVC